MSITTEQAEQMAEICDQLGGFAQCAAALRSIAAERDALRAENEKLRELLRPFIYTGNVKVGFRIGQNPPPITASDEEAWKHYAGNEVHFFFWRQWRAVKIGRELLGEEE
jgi:hypothetical protein